MGKIKKKTTAPNNNTNADGTNHSIPSNMFRDTLAAPFYNNSDEDQVHSKHHPLVSLGALSHQGLEGLLTYYPGAPLSDAGNISRDPQGHFRNSYNVLG